MGGFSKKKSSLFIICFFLAMAARLPAQTAAELEALLETPEVTCAQAARFVMGSRGTNSSGDAGSADNGGAPAAFEQAAAMHWLPSKAAPGDTIRLGELSFLMVRAFNIQGGFMSLLLPGPRYAFRTMVSRSLIQGAADPALPVSGERFLQILGNVLALAGGE